MGFEILLFDQISEGRGQKTDAGEQIFLSSVFCLLSSVFCSLIKNGTGYFHPVRIFY